jgi:hypothetical protein
MSLEARTYRNSKQHHASYSAVSTSPDDSDERIEPWPASGVSNRPNDVAILDVGLGSCRSASLLEPRAHAVGQRSQVRVAIGSVVCMYRHYRCTRVASDRTIVIDEQWSDIAHGER